MAFEPQAKMTDEVVVVLAFKKVSEIKNFYHLFHHRLKAAVPLPLCRGRLEAREELQKAGDGSPIDN